MDIVRVVPIITVTDIDSSAKVYEEVLGLHRVMDHGWIATFSDGDGLQISLMTRDETAPCNPTVSVEVSDVDEAYRRAQDTGAEIVHALQAEAWGVRRFFVKDAAGAVINVLSHLPA